MVLDPVLISRIQFAFTISFHILFPAFSIGLATFLAVMEGAWLASKNPKYLAICQFWMKVFALTFGMGIVSGIVMEFQLGTNWAGFTKMAGPVLGSLFTYEVLTAFFIEAGFLGVMIFGWEKVGSRLHYLATLLVVFGVTLSAFWILSANSWMQTPDGASLIQGQFRVDDWMRVIFNHTTLPRYFHMMLAAYLSTALVIAGVSGYYLLKQRHLEFARTCFSFALYAIVILTPLQAFLGDTVGLNVHAYQPLKTAAMEGVWQTQKGAPLILFALPDQAQEKNLYTLEIPHLAAVLNTHAWNGELIGLDTVARSDQPVVVPVFFSFRIMVGLGLLMLLLGVLGLLLRIIGRLYTTPWFFYFAILCSPIGFFSVITGWFTAEFGRQPWVVYQVLRTADAISPIKFHDVAISLALIIIVYGIMFGVFYFRYFFRLIAHGPTPQLESTQPFAYMQGEPHE